MNSIASTWRALALAIILLLSSQFVDSQSSFAQCSISIAPAPTNCSPAQTSSCAPDACNHCRTFVLTLSSDTCCAWAIKIEPEEPGVCFSACSDDFTEPDQIGCSDYESIKLFYDKDTEQCVQGPFTVTFTICSNQPSNFIVSAGLDCQAECSFVVNVP
jgi:hypothetical protein